MGPRRYLFGDNSALNDNNNDDDDDDNDDDDDDKCISNASLTIHVCPHVHV